MLTIQLGLTRITNATARLTYQLGLTEVESATPPPSSGFYVAEDGVSFYVTEDGLSSYVVES